MPLTGCSCHSHIVITTIANKVKIFTINYLVWKQEYGSHTLKTTIHKYNENYDVDEAHTVF